MSALLLAAACSGSDPGAFTAPCDEPRVVVDNDASLAEALSNATPGLCVVLRAGVYQAPIVIDTDDVAVVAATGEDVRIVAEDGEVGIRVAANGVTIIGVEIDGGDYGVRIDGRRGTMSSVEISQAREAAVGIKCEDQDCLRPTELTSMVNVAIRASNSGIIVSGGILDLMGTTIEQIVSQRLAGGVGIFAVDGAVVTMTDSTVRSNDYGIVADGATTRLAIVGGLIEDNAERGVWAQGLVQGALPALSITQGTTIRRNGLVGVGLLQTEGVVLDDVVIRDTRLKTVAIDAMQTADIGDGIGVFDGSSEVMLTNVALENNERAQGVINAAGPNVTFAGSVSATGGTFLVVVQDQANMVMVPSNLISIPPTPLFVKRDPLTAPGLP